MGSIVKRYTERLPDWSDRLDSALERFRGKPFAYGRCDCGSLMAAVVYAVTGHDISPQISDRYASKETLARFMIEMESRSPGEFFEKHVMPDIGWRRIARLSASRGDLCTAQGADAWPAFGVILNEDKAAFMGLAGLQEFNRQGRVLVTWGL